MYNQPIARGNVNPLAPRPNSPVMTLPGQQPQPLTNRPNVPSALVTQPAPMPGGANLSNLPSGRSITNLPSPGMAQSALPPMANMPNEPLSGLFSLPSSPGANMPMLPSSPSTNMPMIPPASGRISQPAPVQTNVPGGMTPRNRVANSLFAQSIGRRGNGFYPPNLWPRRQSPFGMNY